MNPTRHLFRRSTMLCLSLAAVFTLAIDLPLAAQSTAAKSESKVDDPAPRTRVVPPKAQEFVAQVEAMTGAEYAEFG